MPKTPHKEKLLAAIANPKCKNDAPILRTALEEYENWIKELDSLTSSGKQKVMEMTNLLNQARMGNSFCQLSEVLPN